MFNTLLLSTLSALASVTYGGLTGVGPVAESGLTSVGPIATLRITDAVIAPDGFSRTAIVTNGVYPAPVVTALKDSYFNLNVVNALNASDGSLERTTSIHWHGLFQPHTNAMDGVDRVNQCPIIPGHSFNYIYNAPGQAGTYWYHSHDATQYCDGLRSAFIIYDPDDPHKDEYDVDNLSTVLVVGDWFHTPTPEAGLAPLPDSTLFNSAGRYPGGPATPLSVTNVIPGLRYRLRLVLAACHPNYIFSIDNHNLTIIEADAQNTDPLTVDSIQIFPGQRYSLVITANQPVANYWIRALPSLGNNTFDGGVNSAILRYAGAPHTDPTSTQTPSVIPFVEANLQLLGGVAVPGSPVQGGGDVNINLALAFNAPALAFTINGATWVPPSVPVLQQLLSGVPAASLLPTGSIIPLPRNATVEVTLPALNIPGGPHPFHLHGHAFDVVRSADSTTYNYVNPVRRDVVSIGGGPTDPQSNVTIRFVTDNPGPWILHCHIEFHLALGFAIVFAEDPADVPTYQTTTTQWQQLCSSYNAFESSISATSTATA